MLHSDTLINAQKPFSPSCNVDRHPQKNAMLASGVCWIAPHANKTCDINNGFWTAMITKLYDS